MPYQSTMKHLIKIIACLSILLPVTASAAKYGDFRVGKKFSLKVTKITSTERIGYFDQDTNAPVSALVPKYRRNSRITFTIGRNGMLTTKRFRLPFTQASETLNEYNLYKTGTISSTYNAEITKNSKNQPIRGTLNFYFSDFTKEEPVFGKVIYELE